MRKIDKRQRLFDFADFLAKKAEIYYGFKVIASLSVNEINEKFEYLKDVEGDEALNCFQDENTFKMLESYLDTFADFIEAGEDFLDDPKTRNEFLDKQKAVRNKLETITNRIPFLIYNNPDLPPSFKQKLMNEEGTDSEGLEDISRKIKLFLLGADELYVEVLKSFLGDESEDIEDEESGLSFKSETRELLDAEAREGTIAAQEGAGGIVVDEKDMFGKGKDGTGNGGFAVIDTSTPEGMEKARQYMRQRYARLSEAKRFDPNSFLAKSSINLDSATLDSIINQILSNRKKDQFGYINELNMSSLIRQIKQSNPQLNSKDITVTRGLIMNLLGQRAYQALLTSARVNHKRRMEEDPVYQENIKERNNRSNSIADQRLKMRKMLRNKLVEAIEAGDEVRIQELKEAAKEFEESVANIRRVNKKELSIDDAVNRLLERVNKRENKPKNYTTNMENAAAIGEGDWLKGYTNKMHYNIQNTIQGINKKDILLDWQAKLYDSIPLVANEMAEFKKLTRKDVKKKELITEAIVNKMLGVLKKDNPVLKVMEGLYLLKGKALAFRNFGATTKIDTSGLTNLNENDFKTILDFYNQMKNFHEESKKYSMVVARESTESFIVISGVLVTNLQNLLHRQPAYKKAKLKQEIAALKEKATSLDPDEIDQLEELFEQIEAKSEELREIG